jgi:hypothetical protein
VVCKKDTETPVYSVNALATGSILGNEPSGYNTSNDASPELMVLAA